MKTINIFGCCICRDIFRINSCGDRYKILRFVQNVSPISAFDKKKEILKIEDLNFLDCSDFKKRNCVLNINGTTCDYFKQEEADYFILDLA